jgi:thioredoxin reductase
VAPPTTARGSSQTSSQPVDVAIVGAGPYGLSIAAHLAQTKLRTRVFGTPMQSWRNNMPPNMTLKSEGFASNLYNPGTPYTIADYCRENNLPYEDIGLPVPVQNFIGFGLEFQRRFVPHLEQTDIASIQQTPTGFQLQTALGETLLATHVVIAAGISAFPYIPPSLTHLPAQFLSHSFDHHTLDHFRNRRVLVLGAGASAINTAGFLDEAGAEVEIIVRSPRVDFHRKSPTHRPLLTRLRSPRSGLGVGWKSKLAADFPLLFHALPEKLRLRAVHRHLGPAPGWDSSERVEGKLPIHVNTTIQSATIENNQLHLVLNQPTGPLTLTADHLVAATGFRPAISRLIFLDEPLRNSLHTVEDTPILNRNFESSVPNLYFVGLASANSFGPPSRFACGAEFAAKHLCRHLTKR